MAKPETTDGAARMAASALDLAVLAATRMEGATAEPERVFGRVTQGAANTALVSIAQSLAAIAVVMARPREGN